MWILVLSVTCASAAEIAWPARVADTNSPFTVISGDPPREVGRVGHARVFHLDRADGGGDRYLIVTTYARDRGNPQAVSVSHARGVCRLGMQRHNGSTAVFRPTAAASPRGLFVYLTGIIGLTPPEETLVETFRAAGWHTLISETSFNFMRRRSVLVAAETLDATARQLGRDTNDHLADKAYAVEAMLRVIAKDHPDLRTRPRVLAGGSAGSIAVPAVAARIGRSAAVILIGAGGNVGRILCESSLEPVSLYQLTRDGDQTYRTRLDEATRQRMAAAIYAHTPLDPLLLAPRMRGHPILMMRGELDQMVPTATNDLLWEAMERPDRWSLPVNHLVLFGMLQFQSGTILRWTEQALAGGNTAP
jgi:hypothetical protein